MSSIIFSDNGLNVQYISDFIEKAHADRYLTELKTLPFYRPTFHLRGKDVKPKRLVLAYGDPNTSYAFSGTSVPSKPWTSLMIELRDKVERETACTFNYVLLNLYQDGTTYISHHKDNESSLNAMFPITVLSFGAQRTIEFKRPSVPSTFIKLEHGSFYNMLPPTNELFTHGIGADPAIKDVRISLTFRHLIVHPLDLKKPRLDLMNDPELNLDLFAISPDYSPPTASKHVSPLNRPQEKLSTHTFHESDGYFSIPWNLEWNTCAQIEMDKNCNLKLHIRIFKEGARGELFPTKNGIVMTPLTYDHFQQNMIKFNFYSVKDSYVSNNQLLTAFSDEGHCILQQIFKANQHSFHFKPEGIRLSIDQFLKLREAIPEITDCMIDMLLVKAIPMSVLRKSKKCIQTHTNEDSAKKHFLSCFDQELERSLNQVYTCYACTISQLSQLDHDCLNTSLREKFVLYRDSALLNFNVYQFVKNLTANCLCHYTPAFFDTLNSNFYVNYLETVFVNSHEV